VWAAVGLAWGFMKDRIDTLIAGTPRWTLFTPTFERVEVMVAFRTGPCYHGPLVHMIRFHRCMCFEGGGKGYRIEVRKDPVNTIGRRRLWTYWLYKRLLISRDCSVYQCILWLPRRRHRDPSEDLTDRTQEGGILLRVFHLGFVRLAGGLSLSLKTVRNWGWAR